MTKVIKNYNRKRAVRKFMKVPFCQHILGPFNDDHVYCFVASQDLTIENINIKLVGCDTKIDPKYAVSISQKKGVASIVSENSVTLKADEYMLVSCDSYENLTSLTISFSMKIKA